MFPHNGRNEGSADLHLHLVGSVFVLVFDCAHVHIQSSPATNKPTSQVLNTGGREGDHQLCGERPHDRRALATRARLQFGRRSTAAFSLAPLLSLAVDRYATRHSRLLECSSSKSELTNGGVRPHPPPILLLLWKRMLNAGCSRVARRFYITRT